MAEDKVKGRYFYLMLKENFYDSDDMVLLESMENGYKYSNILLKLYLRSLKDKGKLMYKDRIPYSVEMLAKLTRHDPDTVRRAIEFFQNMGIIEILDNGAIFMMDIENYIGKSSTEADRRRAYDRRIAAEKKELLLSNTSENSCESSCENSCEKSHEHIDTELDIDINTNIKKEIKKESNYDLIINDLVQDDDLKELLYEFIKMRKIIKSPLTDKALKMVINKLYKLSSKKEEQLEILNNSIINNWKDIYPLKGNNQNTTNNYKRIEQVPEWLNKDIKPDIATPEEQKEIKDMLNEYKPNPALQEKLKRKYGPAAANSR